MHSADALADERLRSSDVLVEFVNSDPKLAPHLALSTAVEHGLYRGPVLRGELALQVFPLLKCNWHTAPSVSRR